VQLEVGTTVRTIMLVKEPTEDDGSRRTIGETRETGKEPGGGNSKELILFSYGWWKLSWNSSGYLGEICSLCVSIREEENVALHQRNIYEFSRVL